MKGGSEIYPHEKPVIYRFRAMKYREIKRRERER
jgi:hypothetical protein